MAVTELADYPPRADLLTEIYQPLPKVTATVDWNSLDVATTAEQAIREISIALQSTDRGDFIDLFLANQSFWRDTLAITSHLRTFKGPDVIVTVLRELNTQRGIDAIAIVPGSAQVVVASETLVSSPAFIASNFPC